jgi:Domain of unknown function (DUF4864)
MDDPLNTPDPNPPKESVDPGAGHEPIPPAEPTAEIAWSSAPQQEPQRESAFDEFALAVPQTDAAMVRKPEPAEDRRAAIAAYEEGIASRRRSFRHNLFLLLSLALAAFILTSWILVRVDSPFGIFSTGPQEIVRAQLRALDRGELRPAYDMFSPRYRGQVSFDTWHELFVTHWRMFHADVVRSETPAYSGPGVTLEIYLRGADDRDYRARFTLIRTDGRWWIDDVHWTEEADERDVSRT